MERGGELTTRSESEKESFLGIIFLQLRGVGQLEVGAHFPKKKIIRRSLSRKWGKRRDEEGMGFKGQVN